MWKKTGPVWLFILIVLAAVYSAFFTVDQTEQALVLQLGEPVGKARNPGFHVKIPFLQDIEYIKTNLREYDPAPVEMLSADKKKLTLDTYLKWAVIDPWLYYKTVREESRAQRLLWDLVLGELKTEIGRVELAQAASGQKQAILEKVTKRTSDIAKKMGMRVADVRIKNFTLAADAQKAVFERMISQRQRQAAQLLAQGGHESQVIKSQAEQEAKTLLAQAAADSQEIEGAADAEAAGIYAASYQKAPEFYGFLRNLELYRRSFDGRSTLFLSRDDEVMKLIKGK